MKQLLKVWWYKRKAAHALRMSGRSIGADATYQYQRYIYYTNKLKNMD